MPAQFALSSNHMDCFGNQLGFQIFLSLHHVIKDCSLGSTRHNSVLSNFFANIFLTFFTVPSGLSSSTSPRNFLDLDFQFFGNYFVKNENILQCVELLN